MAEKRKEFSEIRPNSYSNIIEKDKERKISTVSEYQSKQVLVLDSLAEVVGL